MPAFTPGVPIDTADPQIDVAIDPSNPLSLGEHTFQLVVVDEAGNVSDPVQAKVVVKDTQRPTAVLKVKPDNGVVEFGQSFTLLGNESSDKPPGKIVTYRWTLLKTP